MNSRMIAKLLFWFTVLEKVIPEPNLCEMSLILVLSIDFFNSIEHFSLEIESFPNFREPSPSQLFTLQIPLNKRFILNLTFT
jgi:hypothetical protein